MNVENWIRWGATFWMQSFVVLSVGLLGARLLRRRGSLPQMAALRATLLGVALCAVVSLGAASRVSTRWNVSMPPPSSKRTFVAPFVAPHSSTTKPATAELALPKVQNVPEEISVSAATPVVPIVEEQAAPLSTWASVYRGVALLWLSGSALWLLWLSMCALRLARVRRSSTRIVSGEWHDALKSLCDIHGWRQPQLLQSREVLGPLLTGLWRPAMVLPREDAFDSSSRRAVLLHEMTHLQRRDLWWMSATRVLCAVLWPQPLLWILNRQMERVAEDVCDEAVVRAGCAPRDYARCLLDLSERLTLRASERAVAAGVVPRQSSLGQRVRRILDERRGAAFVARPLRALIGVATLGAIVTAVCAIGVSKRFGMGAKAETIVAGPLSSNARWRNSVLEKRLLFRPQSQTINGMTVRVLDARWNLADWKQNNRGGDSDFQKDLRVQYEVTSDRPKERFPKGKSVYDYTSFIMALDDFGFQANNGSSTGGRTFELSGLDPRKASVPLELELLDPDAPPNATGKFQETLVFKNVPLPGKRDQVLPVRRSLTTAHGTRLFLEAIAVSSAKSDEFFGNENQVLMSVYSLPPAQTPDMATSLQINYKDGVVGTKGEEAASGSSAGWIGTDSLGNLTDAVTLYVDTFPSMKVRNVNIRIQVSEEAPSLKQEKWFHRFRFQLPRNQISLGAITSLRPLAVADASDLSVSLDSLKKFDNYKTYLGIANKKGADWNWNVESATLNGPAAESWPRNSGDDLYWKPNGRPTQPGEKGVALEFRTLGFFGKKTPAPKSLEMRVGLQAQSRKRRVVNFQNLPVPRGNQTLLLNRTVNFPSGAWFTIRKVESGTFDTMNHRDKDKSQPTKIAITYETNNQASSEHWIELEKKIGTDNLGHSLQESRTSYSGQTLYYLPPSLKSTSFDLRLLLAVVTPGPRKTIVFHDLPAPKSKPQGK